MTKILLIILTFGSISIISQTNCKKCDLSQVKKTNEHLNNLTVKVVGDFLCTFDTSCTKNAKYVEWSNETLFSIIYLAPEIFIQAIAERDIDENLIAKEIKHPVHKQDMQKCYDNIKRVTGYNDLLAFYLRTIIQACSETGTKIVQ
jgi:hypothetical protein